MTLLVVGGGGLLGRAVVAEARHREQDVIVARVPWQAGARSVAALTTAFEQLLATAEHADEPWRVAWCAGAGVVATERAALDAEVEVFEQALAQWTRLVGEASAPGALFLASSAGGVYAGSADPPFHEQTPPRPLRPYGHAKLAMEGAALAFAERTGTGVLVGRISNLYGPGQDLGKGQGLISAMCRAEVTGEPLGVHVPLSTTRDYLYVTDCAEMILTGLAQVQGAVVKILAGGRGTGHSITELLDVFTHLYGGPPPHTTGDAAAGVGQVADLRFASRVWPQLDALADTPLEVGIATTMQDIRARTSLPTGRQTHDTTHGAAG